MTDASVLRTMTDDDVHPRSQLIAGAFLGDATEERAEHHALVNEPERIHVVEDAGQVVATGGILTRDLTVPGAMIPAAHVTAVAVAATHRRRGLLTRIMTAQFDDVRSRGTEPLAVLWASEGAIYGRFGYGLAAWHVDYTIATRETSVAGGNSPGRLRQVDPAKERDVLAAVFDRTRDDHPGWSSRPGQWWEFLTTDPAFLRHGKSARRGVVYEVDGVASGYATWRVKGEWTATGPNGEVHVEEVVAETTDAYAALWRFLTSIDLTRTVKYAFAAPDEPLAHMVTNAKGIAMSAGPSLWVRILDVPAALAARRYAVPVDVVVQVTDERVSVNDGRWHLTGDGAAATCKPVDTDPDLSLDVRALGAAYLGGTSLTTLAAAGQVTEHRDGALAQASVAFGWHRQPASIEVF